MKKLYTTLFIALFCNAAQGQAFSMDDLVSLASANTAQFGSYVSKKGYRTAEAEPASNRLVYTYFDKKAKEEQPPRKHIYKQEGHDKAIVAYQTTVQAEFDRLCNQLQQEGYTFSRQDGEPLYQKGPVTIRTSSHIADNQAVYSLIVEKKTLPHPSNLAFAEDLLQLTSHEYLAAVFGANNVRKDVFYFSETEVNSCSVLFPNSSRQVIFIWQDEAGKKDIDFLLIGGHLRAKSTVNYHKQIELNYWRSRQGIRSGMTLRELEELNGQPFDIHGWDSEQPGVIVEDSKGKIDFKKVGVVLNCFDCNEDRYYSKTGTINSAKLLSQGRRVFVNTLVVLPSRQ